MSKGVGQLQLDILAHLDGHRTNQTSAFECSVTLPEGVYDLRRVARNVH